MFEKYNEKARRALFFARYEASKLGSKVIESEHLLLGILREGEDIIKEIFARFNVKPEEVRREIEGDLRDSAEVRQALAVGRLPGGSDLLQKLAVVRELEDVRIVAGRSAIAADPDVVLVVD